MPQHLRCLTSLVSLLFLTANVSYLYAQNIGGIINTCTAVNNINNNVLTVASAAGFVPGDKVLVIQMQGATINQVNNASFGQITAYGDAGNYEFCFIQSIVGNTITLTSNLCNTYTIAGRVQLVRVPVYNNPTVTTTLTCQPWNGTTGGVLVFDALNTLTLNANIDVTGNGFRGGTLASSYFACADAAYASPAAGNNGGRKGEGIALYVTNLDGSRAPQANGGGGANRGNPGAGGGGNFGAGGRGGNEWSGCGTSTIWGLGGYGLTINASKAFMGGGGGGGYRDNGQTTSNGSNGGGIIMISAPSIAGNNFNITSNGTNVTVVGNDEGAGAGGSGGAIFLWCNTFTSATGINVAGGSGGNTLNIVFTGNCHGPGGGGGGGYVYFMSGALPGNVTPGVAGGAAGIVQHNGPCFNQPFGAAPGAPGSVLYNLPPQSLPAPYPNLGNDTSLCAGVSLVLSLDTTYSSYLWNDNSTNPTLTAPGPGTYWVEVPDGCGGFNRDSLVITALNIAVNMQNDTTICPGDSLLLDAGPGYISYVWTGINPNPGNVQSNYVSAAGFYRVVVTDANGCVAADSMNILGFYPQPVVNLGNDTSLCSGQSVTFNAGGPFNSYLWHNNTTLQTFTTNQAGQYFVTVTSNNGCRASDTVSVLQVFPLPLVDLGPDLMLCTGQTSLLDAGPGFVQYTWQNNAPGQTQLVTAAGIYSVTVTDNNGCTATDAVNVGYHPVTPLNLGPDLALCQGQTVTFNAGPGFLSYLWQDMSMNSTYTTGTAGQYYVWAIDQNQCPSADTVNVTQVFPLPVVNLGPDISFCQGQSATFNAGNGFAQYQWNNNSASPTLVATTAGTYYVTVTDANGCQGSDTARVLQVFPLPEFTLGTNFPLCPGSTNLISPVPDNNYTSYQWQDGFNQNFYNVTDTGTYVLTVTNSNGCSFTASVQAYFNCPTTLYIPNTFTPNNDGKNEEFMAYGTNIHSFKMDIYNRWGEKIKTLPNIFKGWDGWLGDVKAPIGVYTYKVIYVDYNTMDEHVVLGSFSLIR